jgi:neurobeachin-like protein 1/2
MEPFTSLHVWLQDGKFDKADRLFESVEKTWRSCTSNPSDVKELIPEFYTTPEMFCNLNKFDFGTTQQGFNCHFTCLASHNATYLLNLHEWPGKSIDNVKLPPWAKNAHDFVKKNREALECDYVSMHLHHWIDLIWGDKQKPPKAVDACNVFFHLTYSGSVDLETLKATDESLYMKTCAQIDNFGQIPTQLFHEPHPSRRSLDKVDIAVWPVASTPGKPNLSQFNPELSQLNPKL